MLNSEIAQYTRLLEGRIESVNPDGSTNVITMDGARLRDVRAVDVFGQGTPRPNADCLILTDGAKFYLIGLLRSRPSAQQDKVVSGDNPPIEQYAEQGRKILADTNALGLGAAVEVSAATGVRVDAGGVCASEWNGALGQLTHYVERMEVCAVGHRSQLRHNGEVCEAFMTWRSVVDQDAIQRDLNYDENPVVNLGSTLNVDIYERTSDQAVSVKVTTSGQEVMRMDFGKDGSWSWEASGKISASLGGGELNVSVVGAATVESDSKVVVRAPNVYVGDEAGAVPLALSTITNSNDQAIKAVLEAHQHTYVVPLIPGPTIITAPSTIPGTIQTPVLIGDAAAVRAKGT